MSSNTEEPAYVIDQASPGGDYTGLAIKYRKGLFTFVGAEAEAIIALRDQHEATLKAEYEEKIREAYTRAEVIEMVGEEYDCTTCHRLIIPTREWICENCDAIFHEGCEGYSYSGDGEYPSESAYALCESCYTPKKGARTR